MENLLGLLLPFSIIWIIISYIFLGDVVSEWINEKYKGSYFYHSAIIFILVIIVSFISFQFIYTATYKNDCVSVWNGFTMVYYPCSYYEHFVGGNGSAWLPYIIMPFLVVVLILELFVRGFVYKNDVIFPLASWFAFFLLVLLAAYGMTNIELFKL